MSYDICESARAVLAENGIEASLKRLDSFTGKEGTVIRAVPSATVDRYYDRSRTVAAIYQVACRSRSERTAKETAERAADALAWAEVPSLNGSYRFISQEIYTEPAEMDLEEDGFYAYQVTFRAEIETR